MAGIYMCSKCGIRTTSAPGEMCPFCQASAGNGSASSPNFFPDQTPFQNQASNPFQGQAQNPSDNKNPNPFQTQNPNLFGSQNPNPLQNQSPTGFQAAGDSPTPFGVPQRRRHPSQGNLSMGAENLKTGKNTYAGIVQSVEMRHAHHRKPSFMNRLGQSLFRGVPFSMASAHCIAQISVNSLQMVNMDGFNTSKSIFFFCHEDDYAPSIKNGNKIEVQGPSGSDGVIYPHTIYNHSTGTTFRTAGVPAWVVRTAAIALLLLIVMMFDSSISGMVSVFDPAFFQRLGDVVTELIVLIVVGVVLLSIIRQNRKLRSICMWIIALLLAALIMPELGPIIVMIYGLKVLMTGRFF